MEALERVKHATLLFATEQAMLKKVDGAEFDVAKRTIQAAKMSEGDRLLAVKILEKQEQIVLQTADGYFLRFSIEEIPRKKKAALGVRGMKLQDGDKVDAVYLLQPQEDAVAIFREKEVHLNRLRIGKRDTKGAKTRL